MGNIRKMFDRVEITSDSADFPLLRARNLEQRTKLWATVSIPEYRINHEIGLGVNVSPETITFEVVDLSDDNVVLSRSEQVLADVPKWPSYVSKATLSMTGDGPVAFESFLQSAFSLSQPSDLQKAATVVGERMGIRVGNDLDVSIGDGPYHLDSKEIYANIAHLALAISPRIATILQAETKMLNERRARYDAEAHQQLILP